MAFVLVSSTLGGPTYGRNIVVQGDNVYIMLESMNLATSADGGQTWSVAATGLTGTPHGLMIDSSGNLHAVYVSSPNFLYCKRTSGSWGSPETIDSNNPSIWDTPDLAATIDPSGNVHCIYMWDNVFDGISIPGSNQSWVVYRKRNAGGSWEDHEPVEGANWHYGYNSNPDITVDSAGNVHVVWYEHGSSDVYHWIKYSKRTSGSWIGIGGESAVYSATARANQFRVPSICVDGNNVPHISFKNLEGPNSQYYPAYVNRIGGSWSTLEHIFQNYPNQADYGYLHSITVDTAGYINVFWSCYWSASYSVPMWAIRIGSGTWSIIALSALNYDFLYGSAFWAYGLATALPKLSASSTSRTYFPAPPATLVVYATNATLLTNKTATLNGYLFDDGGLTCDVRFEYGADTTYGTQTTLQEGVAEGAFSQAISGLTYGTTYHFRAIAVNSDGDTAYSNDFTFTTRRVGSSVIGVLG